MIWSLNNFMMFVLNNFTNSSNKMVFKETLLHSVIFFIRKLCIYIIIMYYLKEIKFIHCMAQKGLKNSWNIWIPLMNNILLIHVKVNVKSPENVNVMLCYLNILNFPEHTNWVKWQKYLCGGHSKSCLNSKGRSSFGIWYIGSSFMKREKIKPSTLVHENDQHN